MKMAKEGSKADMRMDRKMGIKEGSKADRMMDRDVDDARGNRKKGGGDSSDLQSRHGMKPRDGS